MLVPIRALLSLTDETLQDMEWAAEDRFWEGLELATQGATLARFMFGVTSQRCS